MTKPATFRKSDVKRAIEAARDAGERVVVEITREGTIRLIPVDASPISADTPEEW